MTLDQAAAIVAYVDAKFDELRQQKKGLAVKHVDFGSQYLPEPEVRRRQLMMLATDA